MERTRHNMAGFELLKKPLQFPAHGIQHFGLLVYSQQSFTAKFYDPLQFARALAELSRSHRSEDAVQVHELLDFGKSESDFLVPLDEQNPLQIALLIASISRSGAHGLG